MKKYIQPTTERLKMEALHICGISIYKDNKLTDIVTDGTDEPEKEGGYVWISAKSYDIWDDDEEDTDW